MKSLFPALLLCLSLQALRKNHLYNSPHLK